MTGALRNSQPSGTPRSRLIPPKQKVFRGIVASFIGLNEEPTRPARWGRALRGLRVGSARTVLAPLPQLFMGVGVKFFRPSSDPGWVHVLGEGSERGSKKALHNGTKPLPVFPDLRLAGPAVHQDTNSPFMACVRCVRSGKSQKERIRVRIPAAGSRDGCRGSRGAGPAGWAGKRAGRAENRPKKKLFFFVIFLDRAPEVDIFKRNLNLFRVTC